MQQYKQCQLAYFITLTYADQQATRTPNGFLNLSKRHPQLFLKRLRKAKTGNTTSDIKYYLVGEYGANTKRPHYHAIIFNADIPSIEKAWSHGSVHFGSVNEASVGYTLKYMFKKGQIPAHKADDRQPEFALMSKNWASVTLQTQCSTGMPPTPSIECTAI